MPVPNHFDVGDMIQFRGRRGSVQGIITGMRLVRPRKRASYMEFQVKPTTETREGIFYNVPQLLIEKNLGPVSADLATAARQEVRTIQTKIIDGKENRREGAMHLIALLDIHSGDRVYIRGRGQGNWFADVVAVRSYRGRIGIASHRGILGGPSVRWIWPFCIISNDSADRRRRIANVNAQPVVNNEAEIEDEAAAGDDKE